MHTAGPSPQGKTSPLFRRYPTCLAHLSTCGCTRPAGRLRGALAAALHQATRPARQLPSTALGRPVRRCRTRSRLRRRTDRRMERDRGSLAANVWLRPLPRAAFVCPFGRQWRMSSDVLVHSAAPATRSASSRACVSRGRNMCGRWCRWLRAVFCLVVASAVQSPGPRACTGGDQGVVRPTGRRGLRRQVCGSASWCVGSGSGRCRWRSRPRASMAAAP